MIMANGITSDSQTWQFFQHCVPAHTLTVAHLIAKDTKPLSEQSIQKNGSTKFQPCYFDSVYINRMHVATVEFKQVISADIICQHYALS